MANYTYLNAKDFDFAPFVSDVGGDSGKLLLATQKNDNRIQYVVKYASPELACNEFMYHHIAAALGLYTQEARLFRGIRGKKHAVGIRYVPNAKEFIHDEASEENKRTFYKFKALFIILNEDDSEELYYDEHNRVFKLDNAASFNLSAHMVEHAMKYGNKVPPEPFWQQQVRSIHFFEYEKYGILSSVLDEHFGAAAAETAFEFIRQFAALDVKTLYPACELLEQIYPLTITEYYKAFVEPRTKVCKKFIKENS